VFGLGYQAYDLANYVPNLAFHLLDLEILHLRLIRSDIRL